MISRERPGLRAQGLESRGGRRPMFGRFDWFVILNLALFLVVAGSVLLRRFVLFRGEEHLGEFGIYAVVSVVGVTVAWRALRRFEWPVWLLLAVELAILIHFAGGLVTVDGGRLYDVVSFGVRFDKVVHLVNSFVAALVVSHVTRQSGLPVVLMVLGLGTVWEVVEYAVVSRVPEAGVGLYENNLEDLIANLAGAVAWWVMSVTRRAVRRPGREGIVDGPTEDAPPLKVNGSWAECGQPRPDDGRARGSGR